MTTEEKINKINRSNNLNEINSPDIIPNPDTVGGYFFLYYPKNLYKQAFIDVLQFNEANVHIYYDRRLEAGDSYKQDMLEKIAEYNCLGVLIYLNSEALLDPFCKKICFAMSKFRKSGFAVNFCFDENERVISGAKMAAKLGNTLDDNTREFYQKMFADEITYVEGGAPFSEKLRALKGIDKPDVLDYEYGEDYAVVTGVKDIFVDKVVIPEKKEYEGRLLPVVAITGFVFANCSFLSEIIFPCTLKEVGGYSKNSDKFELIGYTFENCRSLKKIAFPEETVAIYSNVFQDCSELKSVSAPGVEYLDYDFLGEKSKVKSLRVSENVKKIGNNFYCDKVFDKLTLPQDVKVFGYTEALGVNGELIINEHFDSNLLTDNVDIRKLVIYTDNDESEPNQEIMLSVRACPNLTHIECIGDICGREVFVHIEKCNRLTTLKLPEGASIINLTNLNNCYELKSIDIPKCHGIKYKCYSKFVKNFIKIVAAKEERMRKKHPIEGFTANDKKQQKEELEFVLGELYFQTMTLTSSQSLRKSNKVVRNANYSIEDKKAFSLWFKATKYEIHSDIDQDNSIGAKRKKVKKFYISTVMGLAYIPLKIAAAIAKFCRAINYKSNTKVDKEIVTTRNIAKRMPHLSTIYIKEVDEKFKIKKFRLENSDRDGHTKFVRSSIVWRTKE